MDGRQIRPPPRADNRRRRRLIVAGSSRMPPPKRGPRPRPAWIRSNPGRCLRGRRGRKPCRICGLRGLGDLRQGGRARLVSQAAEGRPQARPRSPSDHPPGGTDAHHAAAPDDAAAVADRERRASLERALRIWPTAGCVRPRSWRPRSRAGWCGSPASGRSGPHPGPAAGIHGRLSRGAPGPAHRRRPGEPDRRRLRRRSAWARSPTRRCASAGCSRCACRWWAHRATSRSTACRSIRATSRHNTIVYTRTSWSPTTGPSLDHPQRGRCVVRVGGQVAATTARRRCPCCSPAGRSPSTHPLTSGRSCRTACWSRLRRTGAAPVAVSVVTRQARPDPPACAC